MTDASADADAHWRPSILRQIGSTQDPCGRRAVARRTGQARATLSGMTLYGGSTVAGPDGLTYGVLLTDLDPDDLTARLTAARFTGFAGPGADRWSVAVADDPVGHVASRHRRLFDLATDLAADAQAAVAGIAVVRDRLLRIWAGTGAQQVIDYVSDPTVAGLHDDEEATDAPVGAGDAPALAAWAGAPEAAPDVLALLGETLGESHNESERLHGLCRLLGWPEWLVSVDSLPRRLPGGDPTTFTRLQAGRTGVSGWAAGRATRVVRRRE